MGIRAIVVDDDEDVRDVFAELLDLNNIDVIGKGSNGKEAVELYKKLHPDIVFIDALMPGYDGFYGLEKIREHDPNSIVVMVTGSFNVEEKLDGCDATAILSKPADMNEIKSVLNKFCIHYNENPLVWNTKSDVNTIQNIL